MTDRTPRHQNHPLSRAGAGLRSQQGGALIVVMMVGLVIAIGFAGFITNSVLVEARAVEGSLAQSRAYWAQMGNFNYALSRISRSKLCNSCILSGNNKDTDLAPVLQRYFNELNNYKTWAYPDAPSSYTITTTNIAAADNAVGRQTYSGWLMVTPSVASSSLVSNLNGHLPIIELRLCVGLPLVVSKCGGRGNNNGGNATSHFSINRLTNLPG